MPADDQLLDYVLGILDPEEVAAIELRLKGDAAARAEVRALRESLLSLSDDLPAVAPPPQVYQQLEASFRALKSEQALSAQPSLAQAEPRSPPAISSRTAPRRSRMPSARPLPRLIALAVSSVAVVVALIWGAVTLRAGQPAELLNAYLNDPSVRRLELKNEAGTLTGRVLVRPDGRTLIEMTTALPAGKIFQAWGVTGPANRRVATALKQSDQQIIEVDRQQYPILWISIEPSGGSPQPTLKVGRVKVG